MYCKFTKDIELFDTFSESKVRVKLRVNVVLSPEEEIVPELIVTAEIKLRPRVKRNSKKINLVFISTILSYLLNPRRKALSAIERSFDFAHL